MSKNARRVCDLIWKNWRDGTAMPALPADLKPRTRAEGYAMQAGLERHSAHPRAGWKIAATSEAGQRHVNVDGPMAGRLLAENLFPEATTLSIATSRMSVAEPEFAFRFGKALPSRPEPYATDEAMAAVDTLHLAIELPDSRFANFTEVGAPTLIADNACARELILGSAVTANWRALDLAAHRVKCQVAGRYERDGVGSNVLGDPRLALAWCVNEVSRLGIDIAAGEVVTTGTCAVPLELEPGDAVVADFGTLGRISVKIAPRDGAKT